MAAGLSTCCSPRLSDGDDGGSTKQWTGSIREASETQPEVAGVAPSESPGSLSELVLGFGLAAPYHSKKEVRGRAEVRGFIEA